jgi:flavin-binding protein dodecin
MRLSPFTEPTRESLNHNGCIQVTLPLASGTSGTALAAQGRAKGETAMSVAKVSEISATSTKSFEDAIHQGLARAAKTLRGIQSAWIKEQQVRLDKGVITQYQVNMMVTFILDD